MKSKIIATLLIISSLLTKKSAVAQQTFYDLSTIQTVEIFFTQANWDYQMDTAKSDSDSFIMADVVTINGVSFDSVGVKYKGNSSYDSSYAKNPMHIELDAFKNQSYQGIKDVKLGNAFSDPSMIREVLAYKILEAYADCPRSNFAKLYINGNYIGLYSNEESVNKDFLSNHFYGSKNTFFKCNPIVNPNPTTKCNLRYLPGVDSSGYFNYYELKSDYGWNDLVALCDSVTNNPASLENVMDVDRAIWMLAFNNVLVNLDSYSGLFAQNYYLYKDNTDRFNPVIWDLNMAFGGFPFAGANATSTAQLTIANMKQMPTNLHSTDVYWPLINRIQSNAMYKRMYIAHMKTIVSEYFTSGAYEGLATQYQALIDQAVQDDTNKFYSYADFQSAMTTDISIGNYDVPGIKNLMDARRTYLENTAEFTAVAPTISNINPSTSLPALNDQITISVNVSSATNVYLGYRNVASDKFIRIPMYDDGAHNDGTAGDNVYATQITITGAVTQFYIYAENNDAGIFAPLRAEHEFYTIPTDLPLAQPGSIVINEFLAVNQNDTTDENGKHEDWIELYNTTSDPISLFGLYMTDDLANMTKFAFPENSFIPASGYLVIFADEDASTPSYLHCNFKLSAAGEKIILSNQAGYVHDSISFGVPTQDVSIGRCPNGTGNFITLPTTSFNTLNCTVGVDELNGDAMHLAAYPNPANDELIVTLSNRMSQAKDPLMIIDALGRTVAVFEAAEWRSHGEMQEMTIAVNQWPAGLYTARCGNAELKLSVMH
jgi:hypothetical protein